MSRKIVLPSLLLVIALMGCSLPINPSNPTVTPVVSTDVPPTTVPAISSETPTLPPAAGPSDVLRNATYNVMGCDGALHDYTLTDGSYVSGSDPAAINYTSVFLGNMIGYGDLNNDGISDEAVILGLNCGGTGVFTYIAAVLSTADAPLTAATVFIDDRPMINSLSIVNGEILSDIVTHNATDAMCCPSFQTQQGYRLYGDKLILTRMATWNAGAERSIDINAPADLAAVSYPFNVTGSVTVGPFENTLAYAIYTPDNTKVTSGSVMTDSPDAGAPGNFSLPVDLSVAGVFGLVRIEFSELSMADGSVMTLDSVLVNVH
jgi:hypothetical protein